MEKTGSNNKNQSKELKDRLVWPTNSKWTRLQNGNGFKKNLE